MRGRNFSQTCANHESVDGSAKSTRRRERPRVLRMDEQLMRLQCMESMLTSQGRELCVRGVTRIEEAVETPDLIAMVVRSICMWADDLHSRVEAVRSKFGDLPIVLVCDPRDIGFAVSATRDQVRAFIPTSVGVNVALAVLRLVLAGGTYFPQEMIDLGMAGRTALQRQPMNAESSTDASTELGLTDREAQIVNQIQQGTPNKIIAYQLGISESTVKVHVRHIMRKLHATNRTQLAWLTRQSPGEGGGSAAKLLEPPMRRAELIGRGELSLIERPTERQHFHEAASAAYA